ncbi:MAG TPA: HDOD domain-containing protein [Opitutaceae bacterium]|nr:HDOD domain-containing protein [Opitutaceae bacterium]
MTPTAPSPGSPRLKIGKPDIIRVGQQLPASPRIFSRLASVLKDLNTGVDQVVGLVKMDPGLSAQVIRLSNSVLFGFAEPSSSLEESINRVGFREVYRLVGLAATNQLFPKELALYAVRGDLVWENSLASALAMERLARKQGAEDEQAAYTIGLLRSAGKVLFTRLAAQPAVRLPIYPGPDTEPHLGDWERGLFGMDNPEAAAELMEHWKFDPTIRLAIRHHYDPLVVPDAPREAALLNCAGWVVHQLGKSLPGEAAYWRRDPAKLERAGVLAEAVDAVVEEVRTELDVLKSAVSMG